MNTLPPLEPLLDVKAVSRILGVHPQTVWRLVRSGRLPSIRYGRHWRFRQADVAGWIAAHAFDGRGAARAGSGI